MNLSDPSLAGSPTTPTEMPHLAKLADRHSGSTMLLIRWFRPLAPRSR